MRLSRRNLLKTARRVIGFGGEWFFNAWAAAGAVNVVIGPAGTVSEKVWEAAKGVVGLAANLRHVWYAVSHQEQIRQAIAYVNENLPTVEDLANTTEGARRIANTFGQIAANLRMADEQYAQVRGISAASFDRLMQARTHLENAQALMPDRPSLEQIAEASASAAAVLSTVASIIQQTDYNRIYELLDNVASNLGPAEVTATVTVGLASIIIGGIAGKYTSRYWARRGRPNFVDRWIENKRFRHDREYFVEHLDEELGPEVYETTRQHFLKKLRDARKSNPTDS